MRVLAILMVFWNHSFFIVTAQKLYGGRGVELFFLLSGFLMAFHYGNKALSSSWKDSAKYAWGKVKKFYVLHVATFGVMAAYFAYKYIVHGTMYKGGLYVCLRDAVLNLTLLKSWYFPSAFSFNGVTWFLSTILFIYLLLPKTVNFFQKRSGKEISLAFCCVLALKMILDACFAQKGISPYPGFSAYTNSMYRYLDFLLGYLGFFILYEKREKSSVLVSFLQGSLLIGYLGCGYFFSKIWASGAFVLLGLLLIYAFSLSGGIFDILFGNKIMTHLGNLIFEFFMVHQVLINIFRWKIQNMVGNKMLTLVALFLLALVIAEILYQWRRGAFRKLSFSI